MEDFITTIEWMKLVTAEMDLLARESAKMLDKVKDISKAAEEISALVGE